MRPWLVSASYSFQNTINIQRQCCQCIFSVLSVTEMQQKELSPYLIPLVGFVAVLDRAVL